MAKKLNLRERNLRIALFKTISDAFITALKSERNEHEQLLFDRWAEEGIKTFDVLLPKVGKVGTIGLVQPAESYEIEDEGALLDWAKVSSPATVREVVVPAQEEMRFVEFWPAAKAALLKRLVWDDGAQVMVDPGTGEVVPGIVFRPAGQPTGFQVRLTKDGRTNVLRAWAAGELTELSGGAGLPQIEKSTAVDWDAL
jgi:hypothetical protein